VTKVAKVIERPNIICLLYLSLNFRYWCYNRNIFGDKIIMEKKALTKEKIHRNIALTTALIVIIEAILITLIIVRGTYYLLWTPFVFVIVYGFALFMDLGKLKDLKEEELNKENEEQKVESISASSEDIEE
jgi:fatty acid desaturase